MLSREAPVWETAVFMYKKHPNTAVSHGSGSRMPFLHGIVLSTSFLMRTSSLASFDRHPLPFKTPGQCPLSVRLPVEPVPLTQGSRGFLFSPGGQVAPKRCGCVLSGLGTPRGLSCIVPVLSECWRNNCFFHELIYRNKKPLIFMFLKFWCLLLAQKLFRYNMVSRHGYTLYFVHFI